MDESKPFLFESDSNSELGRSTMPYAHKRPLLFSPRETCPCTHLAVFVITSGAWAALILVLNAYLTIPYDVPIMASGQTMIPLATYHGFLAKETQHLTCGDTLAEAKQRNCTYDILSNAWTPGLCADEKFVQEYQSDESWFPFADVNHTQPLLREELGDMKEYYTNMRDHIIHCSVLWKRQFTAWKEGWKYLDDVLVDEHHTFHCADFLVRMTEKGEDFRKQPITVVVGHVGCHVLGN